eukprot:TRINITY_DN8653_c0_g1_i1.p2 TRINITY_DN8653_c0_g1~~TRINITY_DN8653_c0_g1_i1.p2  ORF type:complete len:115 (+),score=21.49 TRINITY_DN8653_c0_g1_i1:399-743(+)
MQRKKINFRKHEESGEKVDVRNPAAVDRTFEMNLPINDELYDSLSVLALFLGVGAIFFKYKILSWICLVCAIAAIVNARVENTEFKNTFTSLSVAIMSLAMTYTAQFRQSIKQQ